jgi:hypothetical protein
MSGRSKGLGWETDIAADSSVSTQGDPDARTARLMACLTAELSHSRELHFQAAPRTPIVISSFISGGPTSPEARTCSLCLHPLPAAPGHRSGCW